VEKKIKILRIRVYKKHEMIKILYFQDAKLLRAGSNTPMYGSNRLSSADSYTLGGIFVPLMK